MATKTKILSLEEVMGLKSFKILDPKSQSVITKGYELATEKTKKELVEKLTDSNDRLLSLDAETDPKKRYTVFKGFLGQAIANYKRKVNAVKKDMNKKIEEKEKLALEKTLEASLENL